MPLELLSLDRSGPVVAWTEATRGEPLESGLTGSERLLVVFAGAVQVGREHGSTPIPVLHREEAALLGRRDRALAAETVTRALIVGLAGHRVSDLSPTAVVSDPLVWWLACVLRGEMLGVAAESASEERSVIPRFVATVLSVLTRHVGEVRRSSSGQAGDEGETPVHAAVRAMHEHLQGTFRVDRLASELGVPSPHFGRRFKRSTGMSPSRFFVRMRIDHAKQMLDEGAPIGDVWVDAGFYDQSHLSRHFKRVVGVSPTRFREGLDCAD